MCMSREMLTSHDCIQGVCAGSCCVSVLLGTVLCLQAQHEYDRNNTAVRNMGTVVKMCVKAVAERWDKYDELFAHVSSTVSAKFTNYMHRRGHAVRDCVTALWLT